MARAKSFQLPAELQNYQIRESPRAKHVSIKISRFGEIEVVVPQGFNQRKVPEILQQRQDWIGKTMQKLKAERDSLPIDPQPLFQEQLPQQVSFRSPPEDWAIAYRHTGGSAVKATMIRHQLTVTGAIDQVDACQRVLQRWLSRVALLRFTPWLRQVSKEVGLPCGKISVRGQKTRWASCSSQKDISLNYKLLFLPTPLVRYVFIHELCHTIHLNHSPKFWALVSEKEPEYQQLDKELRGGWRYVPEWVER